jgi:hypothetical protein
MERNPYEYDETVPWIPERNSLNETGFARERSRHQPSSLQYQGWQQRVQDQRSWPQDRMSKARALDLVQAYKKRIVFASLVVFGLLSGLVAYHQVGAAANQGQVDPSQSAPATQPSNGDFFDQQGRNNFGSSNPWQPPLSGSRVS